MQKSNEPEMMSEEMKSELRELMRLNKSMLMASRNLFDSTATETTAKNPLFTYGLTEDRLKHYSSMKTTRQIDPIQPLNSSQANGVQTIEYGKIITMSNNTVMEATRQNNLIESVLTTTHYTPTGEVTKRIETLYQHGKRKVPTCQIVNQFPPMAENKQKATQANS